MGIAKADDARRDNAAGKDEGVTFGHVRRGQAVSSWATFSSVPALAMRVSVPVWRP